MEKKKIIAKILIASPSLQDAILSKPPIAAVLIHFHPPLELCTWAPKKKAKTIKIKD